MRSLLLTLLLLISFLHLVIQAQTNNCTGSRVVCDNENITLNPLGPGLDDYNDPDNNPGCLVDGENNTAWYYFEIAANAPPGLMLGFTINPNGGLGEDYDWALYGPNVLCNKLGSPVRCSSSSEFCDFCPQTGMGMNTLDFSEGPGSGDGFVSMLEVFPGDGFFLVIDNFYGSQNGFILSWTGPASEYLDCDVTVPCNLVANAGPDRVVCGGEQTQVQLNGSSTSNEGNETYKWSGLDGATAFLNNPDIPNPTVQIPSGFSGTLHFTLTVNEDSCTSKDQMTITVSSPEANIQPAGPFCATADPHTLLATPAGGIWGGTVTGNIFDPKQAGPGTHTITYTYTASNPPCTDTDSIVIEVFNNPPISISIGEDIELPLGENTVVELTTSLPANQIDTIIWSPDNIVECVEPACTNAILSPVNDGILTATVFDLSGCSAADELNFTVTKDRKIYIPTAFSPNDDGANDQFCISVDPKQIFRIKKLQVYNRWGAIVHNASDFFPDDLTKCWNGFDKSGKINPGVFVYVAEIEFIDGIVEVYSGDITVVR